MMVEWLRQQVWRLFKYPRNFKITTPPPRRWEQTQELAKYYEEPRSIRRVASAAGLDESRIDFDGNALDVWDAVLEEAEKVQKTEQLRVVVTHEYPALRW